MLVETILILSLAGLLSLDKTEIAQTMFSQPLVSGPLVGLILGDLPTGIKIGVIFQLVWFWVVPIGSALFPDTAVGGVLASTIAIWLKRSSPAGDSDLALFILVLYVIVFSLFSGWSIIKQRKLNFGLIQKAEVFSERIGFRKITQLVWLAILLSFVRGAVLVGLGILGFYIILLPLFKYFNFLPAEYFGLAKTTVFGFGCACIFDFFGRKVNWVWIGLGGAIAIFIFFIL